MPDEQPPNSALDVKLNYMQKTMDEIKTDVKEIKNDYIIRREFNDGIKLIQEKYELEIGQLKRDIGFLRKVIYSFFGSLGLAFLGAVFALIFK